MLEERCEGKLTQTEYPHLPSPLLPAGLSGLSPAQIYVMMVSPTVKYIQCL